MMTKNTEMSRGSRLVAIAMAVWLSTFGNAWGQEEAVLKNAEVILVGTVKGMGIANWDVKPSARTVIVHVDEIIRPTGNTPLKAFEGRAVTIELLKAGSIPAGSPATFYTRLWSLGQGLALIELGHTLEPQFRAAAGDPVAAARSTAENKLKAQQISDLSARISAAGIVVVGRVTEVREPTIRAAARAQDVPKRLTEHDPMYREAVIDVQEGIQGVDASTRTVTALFSASEDVLYQDAPRLKVGQEGVFIIDKGAMAASARAAAMARGEQMGTILNPANVLAKDQADLVKKLANP